MPIRIFFSLACSSLVTHIDQAGITRERETDLHVESDVARPAQPLCAKVGVDVAHIAHGEGLVDHGVRVVVVGEGPVKRPEGGVALGARGCRVVGEGILKVLGVPILEGI